MEDVVCIDDRLVFLILCAVSIKDAPLQRAPCRRAVEEVGVHRGRRLEKVKLWRHQGSDNKAFLDLSSVRGTLSVPIEQ